MAPETTDEASQEPIASPDEPVAGTGVIEGNSGSGLSLHQNPWFLDADPVTYCIDVATDAFSLPVPEAERAVHTAIDAWIKALPELRENYFWDPPPKRDGRPIWYSLDFVAVTCDTPDVDLRFGLGRMTPTAQLMRNWGQRKIAYAHMTEYDARRLRGRGEVWVMPDRGPLLHLPLPMLKRGDYEDGVWSDVNALISVLTHELGHVFGFRHDDSTFMHKDFAASVLVRVGRGQPVYRSLATDLVARRKIDESAGITECFEHAFDNWHAVWKEIYGVTFNRLCVVWNRGGPSLEGERPGGERFSLDAVNQGGASWTAAANVILPRARELDPSNQHAFYSLASYLDGMTTHGSIVTKDLTKVPYILSLRSTIELRLFHSGRWESFYLPSGRLAPLVTSIDTAPESDRM